MSQITKPVLTDETGQTIVSKLEDIKNAIKTADPGSPVRITVVTPPTKTSYIIGDTFDPTGIAVSAVFTNNVLVDVTDQCTFSPTTLNDVGEAIEVTVSWPWIPTGQTFTAKQVVSVSVPSWSTGTPEKIAKALEAHYAGDIDISDYWNVGEERTVALSAMTATGVGESHAAQNVVYVISHFGGQTLADGVTECAIQFDQKDSLGLIDTFWEGGYMFSSTSWSGTRGWHNSPRRTWCNEVYKEALPADFKALCKQFQVVSESQDSSTGTISSYTSDDYFALRAEKEVFGSVQYGDATVEASLTQADWYKTSTNIRKKMKDGDTSHNRDWWFRSMNNGAYFCNEEDGLQDRSECSDTYGIAPFGVM